MVYDIEDEEKKAVIVYSFWGILVVSCLVVIFYFGSRPPITCIDGVIHEEISKDVFVKSVPERQCRNRLDTKRDEK